jgi:hypothetical protein
LLRLTDSQGRVRAKRLAAELFRRPGLLLTLMQLRHRSALALRNLSAAVAALKTPFDCENGPGIG